MQIKFLLGAVGLVVFQVIGVSHAMAMSCGGALEELEIEILDTKPLRDADARLIGGISPLNQSVLHLAVWSAAKGILGFDFPVVANQTKPVLRQFTSSLHLDSPLTHAFWLTHSGQTEIIAGDEAGYVHKISLNGRHRKELFSAHHHIWPDGDDEGLVAGLGEAARVRISPIGGGAEFRTLSTMGAIDQVRLHRTREGERWLAVKRTNAIEVYNLDSSSEDPITTAILRDKAQCHFEWLIDEDGQSALVYNFGNMLMFDYPERTGDAEFGLALPGAEHFSTLQTHDRSAYILVERGKGANQLYRWRQHHLLPLDQVASAPEQAVKLLDLADHGVFVMYGDPALGHLIIREVGNSSESRMILDLPLAPHEVFLNMTNFTLAPNDHRLAVQTNQNLRLISIRGKPRAHQESGE